MQPSGPQRGEKTSDSYEFEATEALPRPPKGGWDAAHLEEIERHFGQMGGEDSEPTEAMPRRQPAKPPPRPSSTPAHWSASEIEVIDRHVGQNFGGEARDDVWEFYEAQSEEIRRHPVFAGRARSGPQPGDLPTELGEDLEDDLSEAEETLAPAQDRPVVRSSRQPGRQASVALGIVALLSSGGLALGALFVVLLLVIGLVSMVSVSGGAADPISPTEQRVALDPEGIEAFELLLTPRGAAPGTVAGATGPVGHPLSPTALGTPGIAD